MNKLTVIPQTLYVKVEPVGSVVVESVERVGELYRAQKIIAPSHTAVDSRKLFEFLGYNRGRCDWVAQTLRNVLGEGFSPRYVRSWSGLMYTGLDFFAFAVSIPFADPDLIPENAAVPIHGVLVHLTVFEFNRNDNGS